MVETSCCAASAKEKAPFSVAAENEAGIVKAASLTISLTATVDRGQPIPALIARHIGEPFLALWEGGAR